MLVRDIAQVLGAQLEGDGDLAVTRLVHPAQAERASDLALATSPQAAAALAQTKARAVVIAAAAARPNRAFAALIAVAEPRIALARLTALFDPGPQQQRGVHPTALVAADAELGTEISIGAYATIGPRSRIGAGTTIMPHVTVGAGVSIGAHALIHSGVRVGDDCRLGDRVIVHGNAVVGADGFSFAPDLMSGEFNEAVTVQRIHSLGNVIVGDDVEIGACTTIDRATLESTRIGSGTKIDDHVHIAHNVTIGESCIVCGMVGISGSVIIGDRVRLGGGVGIADHVRIGNQAVVAAGSGVATEVAAGAFVTGYPALPHRRFIEQQLYLGRQRRLHDRVAAMAARLDELEAIVDRTGKK